MILDISPLLRNRDYRLLYAGQLVSAFGSMITYVAVPDQIWELTHSSLAVGMLGAVQLVPLLLFALLGGAYADSMDRRKLLVISEVFLALGSLILAVNALLPRPSVFLVFGVSAAMSALNGFHRPALDALTPRLVNRDDLRAVAALSSLRYSLSAIAGPALGGFLIGRLGISSTYWIDFLTFLISIASLAAIRKMPPPEGHKPGLTSILEGLRYARSRPELIGTYVVDMVAMTFAMPMALFPSMSENWGGAQSLGWLYSAMAMGFLASTLISGWSRKVERHGVAVIAGATVWGIAIVGLGFAQGLLSALLCLALAGAGDNVSAIFRGTIWNETIPGDLRGRLAGVEMISYLSGPLIGNVRAGWVASMSSNRVSIVSGGFVCIAGILLCIPLLPAFWRYRRSSTAAAEQVQRV
jgi:MFS family permease